MKKLTSLRFIAVLFALAFGSSSLYATSLTAGTTTISLTCTKGSTCTSSGTSTLAISAGTGFYTVTPPSVSWVLVTPLSGTATTTASANVLTFSASPAWTTLGSGLYTTTVTIASLGVTSATVTVKLQVNDAPPTLTVKGGVNVLNPVAWVAGAAAPSLSLTLVSSDGLPIAFTATAASPVTPEGVSSGWLTPTTQTGIAYSFGATINFTASANALAQAQAGDVLGATITITPSGGVAFQVPLNIAVSAPTPTVTSLTPSTVPLLSGTVAPGSITLVVKGTSFVSTTGTQKTHVFVSGALMLPENVTVLSSQYLTVSIPYDSTGGVFKTAGLTGIQIGVANGAAPTVPSGSTLPLAVSSAPIISTITSAASFVEPVGAANPKAAPYDILSIFGTNFCPLCTGSNSVVLGAPDTTYYRFPTFLSPDPSATTPHKITVTFSKPGTPATTLPGYLLFATNNQINVMVPGAVITTLATSSVANVQVAYDTATPAGVANTSATFSLATVNTNPGVFTISSNGQGSGAITDASTFALNTQTAPAAPGDTVAIFMTGLGAPDSTGTNVATGSPVFGTNCLATLGVAGTNSVAPTGYMGTVNTAATVTGPYTPPASYVLPSPLWTSIDGAVMRSAIMQGNFAPCFLPGGTPPTVTIGGAAATVVSSGFVADSIAGLYQVNVTVPTPTDTPTYMSGTAQQYNVIVTKGAVASQAAVTMWVD